MLIRIRRKPRNPDAPQRHSNHGPLLTRRQLVAQGFAFGGASVLAGGVLSLFANPRAALAQLAPDLEDLKSTCGIAAIGAGKIPFICFDLAGGANMAGSNVLVGKQGGQFDLLSTAGYRKLGLPGDMVPGVPEATPTPTSNGDHTDTSLGLAFHSDSAFLRGMQASMSPTTAARVNGAVIPARSENDTGNNPHNPLYAIQRAGADGEILTLCGSRPTDSGGNSLAPMSMVNPEFRPTKIDRPSDVVGLVDTGQLVGLLGPEDATAVLESIYRISAAKLADPHVQTKVSRDMVIKDLVRCGYLKAADIAERFAGVSLDPGDPENGIVGPGGIFTEAEWNGNSTDAQEFRKTASIMKLVIDGYAGAGCITMGGYDYHGGARQEGEIKDFRAGRCMGACLEYAARRGVPLMLYVFSDGSLSSNGVIDNSVNGRGKGEWTSDNQDTAASFFLVYHPLGRPALLSGNGTTESQHQQLGYFSPDGDVVRAGTPGANNVNLLVEMVALNYLALHGEQGLFPTLFPTHGLGDPTNFDRLTAFAQIVNGTISNPV